MSAPYTTSRRVEFRDTDAAGIMHFSTFFVVMEEVEHELLRSVGLSVLEYDEEGSISWPRVAAHCDYRAAAKFEDQLDIQVSIIRLGEKSITYGFRFHLGEQEIASGEITSVCCRILPNVPPSSIAIPKRISEKLAPFVCR